MTRECRHAKRKTDEVDGAHRTSRTDINREAAVARSGREIWECRATFLRVREVRVAPLCGYRRDIWSGANDSRPATWNGHPRCLPPYPPSRNCDGGLARPRTSTR